MEQRPDAKAALAPVGQVAVEPGPRLIGSLHAALHQRHDVGVAVMADQQVEVARHEGSHEKSLGFDMGHGKRGRRPRAARLERIHSVWTRRRAQPTQNPFSRSWNSEAAPSNLLRPSSRT